jgi:hypothetical protein
MTGCVVFNLVLSSEVMQLDFRLSRNVVCGALMLLELLMLMLLLLLNDMLWWVIVERLLMQLSRQMCRIVFDV